jgi:hypothetical protein
LQELTSLGFAWQQGIVLAAVDLHDQPGLVAHKLDNIAADWCLAAELATSHSMQAQYLPDPPFCLGHVSP